MRKSSIRRAPQKRDTKWVEYHNIDVTFNYTVNTNQHVDVVDTVIIEDCNGRYTIPPDVVIPFIETVINETTIVV